MPPNFTPVAQPLYDICPAQFTRAAGEQAQAQADERAAHTARTEAAEQEEKRKQREKDAVVAEQLYASYPHLTERVLRAVHKYTWIRDMSVAPTLMVRDHSLLHLALTGRDDFPGTHSFRAGDNHLLLADQSQAEAATKWFVSEATRRGLKPDHQDRRRIEDRSLLGKPRVRWSKRPEPTWHFVSDDIPFTCIVFLGGHVHEGPITTMVLRRMAALLYG